MKAQKPPASYALICIRENRPLAAPELESSFQWDPPCTMHPRLSWQRYTCPKTPDTECWLRIRSCPLHSKLWLRKSNEIVEAEMQLKSVTGQKCFRYTYIVWPNDLHKSNLGPFSLFNVSLDTSVLKQI